MYEIHQATRMAVPALIALWSEPGGGKTFSALHVARGLAGPDGKICMIDTENRRSQFYADYCSPWDFLDLQPPFTPQRYGEAFAQMEASGYKVAIVDSTSHVWMGLGGVLDMADASGKKGLQKWQAPKLQYKRMMNALLRSKIHVIFCLRAKKKLLQVPDQNGKMQIVDGGFVADCEANFLYEMTVAVRLDRESHLPVEIKCPDQLRDVISNNALLSVETGEKIAAWISGGASVDFDAEALKQKARESASGGKTAFTVFWKGLGLPQRAVVKPIMDELQSIAAEADRTPCEPDGADEGKSASVTAAAIAAQGNGKAVETDDMPEEEFELYAKLADEMGRAPNIGALNKIVQAHQAEADQCGEAFQAAYSAIRTERVDQLREVAGNLV